MKSNLDSLFKTDNDLEKDGVWINIGNDIKFKIRRFGGSNAQRLKQAMAKFHKPVARLVEMDKLSPEENIELMAKTFADSCLVDWQGVEIDGVKAPCTFDNAVKLFTQLPELFDLLFKESQKFDSFKEELGNS
jgi:hypothetical protein